MPYITLYTPALLHILQHPLIIILDRLDIRAGPYRMTRHHDQVIQLQETRIPLDRPFYTRRRPRLGRPQVNTDPIGPDDMRRSIRTDIDEQTQCEKNGEDRYAKIRQTGPCPEGGPY